ncbi:MAG: biopolymer transporter ExbD [Deltaproteobacteria bacterium]|jgi:biopolymer transport protein ExbD|nr:biopolymer transporter ExbD [Deltaproteobacteria bacterium]
MNLDSQLTDPWSDDDSLDLTSLIDVLFLLLAFFILAATFAAPAMNVHLSSAKNAAPVRQDEQSLTITVDSEGNIFQGQEQIDLAGLRRLLTDLAPEASIRFNVDQAAPFGTFLMVLDEAKELKRERFMINAAPTGAEADSSSAPSRDEPTGLSSEAGSGA